MPQAIIMAGGQGERFWPLTHAAFPKYLIRLDGKTSLLGRTYARLLQVYKRRDVHVVTTKGHARLIRRELPRLPAGNLIAEPFRNNTASAILYATARIARAKGPSETVSFFPADHLIRNTAGFRATMQSATRLAKTKDRLVLIGVRPAFAATGLGYIRIGRRLNGFPGAHEVAGFTEKPPYRRAVGYLRSKKYLWNGGIFTWRAGVFLETLKARSPRLLAAFDLDHVAASYNKMPRTSIDYALLEKADNLAIVPARMDWCDMGCWDMFLEKAAPGGGGRNYVSGDVRQKGLKGSLILNATSRPVVGVGLSGLIVVSTKRGTLICGRGRSEEAARFS
ncbi:MAG: hypothetical protein A3D28_05500 [Omnitrophica bacterium RIFCSPHIGHO2_02_FULL_63_14]|nr:MAG: hypothetical protein A3D28_05500 [Omnitrophica bacterium RIFCSPHIGHO2_02_FULL_63_14]